MNYRLTMLALFLMTGISITHAEEMKPGKWEYKMESATSATGQEPAHTHSECFTAEDIASGKHLLQDSQGGACKTSNLKTGDGQFSYDVSCQRDNVKLSGSASGQFTASTFSMQSKFKITPPVEGIGDLHTKINGKRVGDC